jgi:two-component system cell cycle sensor histidine kinase PleC
MEGDLTVNQLDILGAALDLARVGLALWDREDRLVGFNATYVSLIYPKQRDEVRLGRKFIELATVYYSLPCNVPPGHAAAEMLAERLKRHAQSSASEYHADNHWFRIAEQRTPDGGTIGVYIDVTEERRIEQMAREGERRLQLLLDNMRNIAYCHGIRGTSGFGYDEAGAKVYGRDVAEMFGTITASGQSNIAAWYDAVHPEDRPRYLAAEEQRREQGDVYSLEYRFSHPVTKQLRWVREVGWTVDDPETKRQSLESYLIDITDAKEREAELASAQLRMMAALDQAHHASLAKSRFLAHMSHELRTPLNAIIGFAQLIAEEHVGPGVSPTYRGYADAILTGGRHLLALINDVLDLSRIEVGKMELLETEFALSELVAEVVAMLQAQFTTKGQRLRLELPDADVALRADRQKLLQILVNLLGNAHKFVPAGGHVAIEVSRADDGSAVIDIADDGPGMDPEQIKSAWTPFSRGSDSFTTPAGTGLGLPISRSFAELHGGTLEIESRKGHGTTLRLRLPAARVLGTEAP